MPKSTMHRFWQRLKAKKTWELAFNFLCSLKLPTNSIGIWKALNVEQCLFNKRLPKALGSLALFGLYFGMYLYGPFGLK
jgi:hypothetical protein